jgi:hypothetical protein
MIRLVNAKSLIWLGAVVVVAAISSDAVLAQGRVPSAGAAAARRPMVPARAFCLRGDRIGRCKSFAIVELPIAARLAQTLRSESGGVGDAYFGLELGGMVNRDESHAIGVSIAGAGSAGEAYVAINVRSRTWFSGKSYRDLSVGVLGMGSSGHSNAYGLTATAGSGYSDLIGVWAGASAGLIGGPPRASVHAGVRLGSYVTTGLIGLVGALVALNGGRIYIGT